MRSTHHEQRCSTGCRPGLRPALSFLRRGIECGAVLLLTSVAACSGDMDAQAGAAASAPSTTGDAGASDRLIAFYQAQAQRDPSFWTNYNRLASAYAQKARETGDISYLQLAEAALQASLKQESAHPEAAPAYTQLATVHLAEHRFHEAADDAKHAMALDPSDLSAVPYAGDAQYELGNYAAAQTFYDRLAILGATAADGTRSHPGVAFLAASHGAGLLWVRGDTAGAGAALQRAIALGDQLHLPAENRAWTHFMLGEQRIQTGDLTGAEPEERAALALFPRYYRALAAMGQIRAAQGRWAEAIDFYSQSIAIVPLPINVAALGDVYRASGNPAAAQKQYELVEYIGKLSKINREVYNRELAVFYADHDLYLKQALDLAKREMDVRADVYTLDALGWALFKNGRFSEAQQTEKLALRLGTRDAMMEFHAGMIDAAAGEPVAAAAHLRLALQINPAFHPRFTGVAQEKLAELQKHNAGVVAADAH